MEVPPLKSPLLHHTMLKCMTQKADTVNADFEPFSQTAGGGSVSVLWGIVPPHCATLGRTLTDK